MKISLHWKGSERSLFCEPAFGEDRTEVSES